MDNTKDGEYRDEPNSGDLGVCVKKQVTGMVEYIRS